MSQAPIRHLLDRDGRGISVLEWPAAGPAIICLHNQWGTAEVWADLPSALGNHFRVLSVDLPGHGHSGAAARDDPVGDLDFLIDRLVGGAAILVGASAGGLRAAAFALEHPERVQRLVLVEPPLLAHAGSRDAERARMSALPDAPKDLETLFQAYRQIFPHARPELLRAYLARTHQLLEGRWQPRITSPEPAGWSGRQSVTFPEFARLQMPVLLLFARHSRLCGEQGALRIQEALPGASVVEAKSSGHLLLLNEPELCYREISTFCRAECETDAVSRS